MGFLVDDGYENAMDGAIREINLLQSELATRDAHISRLLEAIGAKNQALKNASVQLRTAYNYYKLGAEYRITADECIRAARKGSEEIND